MSDDTQRDSTMTTLAIVGGLLLLFFLLRGDGSGEPGEGSATNPKPGPPLPGGFSAPFAIAVNGLSCVLPGGEKILSGKPCLPTPPTTQGGAPGMHCEADSSEAVARAKVYCQGKAFAKEQVTVDPRQGAQHVARDLVTKLRAAGLKIAIFGPWREDPEQPKVDDDSGLGPIVPGEA